MRKVVPSARASGIARKRAKKKIREQQEKQWKNIRREDAEKRLKWLMEQQRIAKKREATVGLDRKLYKTMVEAMKNETGEKLQRWMLKLLILAYQEARKNKRKTRDEHKFEMNEVRELLSLYNDIRLRKYKPSRGVAFIILVPVIREIFAAPFRDRVVHHFVYLASMQFFDNQLINDAYSCRPNKGTLYGIKRLEHFIRSVSDNYHRKAYVIKLDIQGYFMSLNRKKLYARTKMFLDKQFPRGGSKYKVCKYLWREIIFDDPVSGVRVRGNKKLWKILPANKSLFKQPAGRGIVIGNLSSQLLSNLYLDMLDRYIYYQLGYKAYGRYVDDFYIVVAAEQKEQALRDVKAIEKFLWEELDLTLHPKKRYVQEITRGVPFLGVVAYPYRTVAGKRFKAHFYQAVHEYMMDFRDDASITSYLGYLKHVKGVKLATRVFASVGWEYKI